MDRLTTLRRKIAMKMELRGPLRVHNAMNKEFGERSALSSREAPADLLIPVGEFVGLLISALLTIGVLVFGLPAFKSTTDGIIAVAARNLVVATDVNAALLSATKTPGR
jgi:hypothetical protein